MHNVKRFLGLHWNLGTAFAVLLASLLVFSACQTSGLKYVSVDAPTPKQKSGTVTFDLNINIESGKDARLWLPYPTSNEYQTIEDVQITGNYDSAEVIREPQSGTVLLYAEWLQPTGPALITYSFDVTRTEMLRKNIPNSTGEIPVEMQQYLVATSLGPIVGDVKTTTLAATKGQTTVLEKAIAIYDWIIENFQRDPNIVGCGVGDVEALLQSQAGKCTDISSVFVAMARSVGVPAREIFGTRISKDGDITGNYHCRAEFYVPGYGWVPVDPSDVRKFMLNNNCDLDNPETIATRDYYFGYQTETYLDFYTGRDLTLAPAQSGPELNYLMYPYVEIGGRVLDWFAQDELKYTVNFQSAS